MHAIKLMLLSAFKYAQDSPIHIAQILLQTQLHLYLLFQRKLLKELSIPTVYISSPSTFLSTFLNQAPIRIMPTKLPSLRSQVISLPVNPIDIFNFLFLYSQ